MSPQQDLDLLVSVGATICSQGESEVYVALGYTFIFKEI